MAEQGADSHLPTPFRGELPRAPAGDESVKVDAAKRDARLLELWRADDWDAGLELMRLYYRYFLSLCHGYGVNGDEERADLFHDLVMRVHRVVPTLTIERSFAAYLRKVFFTAVRARRPRVQERVPDDLADREVSPTASLERSEMLAAILECSETLNEREKTLFEERHFQERKLAEIAEQQRVTLDHLYVLYHRVRKKMMACLERKGVRL